MEPSSLKTQFAGFTHHPPDPETALQTLILLMTSEFCTQISFPDPPVQDRCETIRILTRKAGLNNVVHRLFSRSFRARGFRMHALGAFRLKLSGTALLGQGSHFSLARNDARPLTRRF